MLNVLLTGGLGYIGSHIAVELLNSQKEYTVYIIDNLSNSSLDKWDKIQQNKTNANKNTLHFVELDLLENDDLDDFFKTHKIDIVIHLAGLKSVGESIQKPITYYRNNLISTLNLIQIMEKYHCKNLIFSSSATVYGNINDSPYHEKMQIGVGITNPYGKTKYMQEEMLKDLYDSDSSWNIIILRYFNPVSQKNESLKETPNGIPNNLFPYIAKVYQGELKQLKIFGNDYKTQDGTCVRDFIHVEDLANGHVKACDYLSQHTKCGFKTYNLGRGKGISVQELLDRFEHINHVKINYQYVERRPGDLEISYANSELAEQELGWFASHDLDSMVKMK